ncbi:MAG: PadR family transcriptional regulator [Spirochaetales bacterium]|nr:PadR family transcriptional regulator [Spirochaetales bacterium]
MKGHRHSGHHDHHGGGRNRMRGHWLNEIKGGRGPRIERGEIRYLLLDTLKESERHGYEIMKAVEEKSGGFYKPSPGSVYPALQMMEDLEWIEPLEEGKKKKYRITELGLQELESQELLIQDIYSDMNQVSSPEMDRFLENSHIKYKMMMKSIYRAYQSGRLNLEDNGTIESLESYINEMVDKVQALINPNTQE